MHIIYTKLPNDKKDKKDKQNQEAAAHKSRRWAWISGGIILVVALAIVLNQSTLKIPAGGSVGTDAEKQVPAVMVPYDLEIEQNTQKSVDEGHSPWRLDPAFVAQVFVSLKISPGGIEGEYPIPYEAVKIIKKTNADAVAEIQSDKSPIKRVYMKRLIRQDESGIWTVVGYDPV